MIQQYGFGYGRLDVVAKHPRRFRGDRVSPAGMMAHPVLAGLALVGLALAGLTAATGGRWQPIAGASLMILATLALERFAAGCAAVRRFRDPTPFVFPVLHLARDFAWVAAIVMWSARRLLGHSPKPSHSMRPRKRGREEFLGSPDPFYGGGPNRPAM
jgi:hypothetical protein